MCLIIMNNCHYPLFSHQPTTFHEQSVWWHAKNCQKKDNSNVTHAHLLKGLPLGHTADTRTSFEFVIFIGNLSMHVV